MISTREEAAAWLKNIFPHPLHNADLYRPIQLRQGIVLQAHWGGGVPEWRIFHEAGQCLVQGFFISNAEWGQLVDELWNACVAWGPARYEYATTSSCALTRGLFSVEELKPEPPEGVGWELCGTAAGLDGDWRLFWTWKRTVS